MSDRIRVVRRMVSACNTGRTEGVEEFIHPDYLCPGARENTPDRRGPDAFTEAVKWLKRAFSEDARWEEVGYEENGEWVRAKLVLRGRHVGDLEGIPATGRRFTGEQVHLIRVVDGRIRDHREWSDDQSIYRQIGEPWPGEGERRSWGVRNDRLDGHSRTGPAQEHAVAADPTEPPDDTSALKSLIRMGSLHTPMVVRVAATLHLVDHLLAGVRRIDTLAEATGTDPRSLLRLVRHLVAIGVLGRQDSGDLFPTKIGLLLAEDHPAGQRAWHDLGQTVARADMSFTRLFDAVRTGRPTYEYIYGKPFYDDLAEHQELRDSFDELLALDQDRAYEAPAAAYDWSGAQHVLDVGGGQGGFLAAVARQAPHLTGTLLEMAGTTDTARAYLGKEGLTDRVEVVEGDFFQPLPVQADVVILSFVLLNWPDHDATRILSRCAQALKPGGRILVHERDDVHAESFNDEFTDLDLRMLVFLGGTLRTREEWDGLASSAGLVVESVRQLPSPTIPFDLSLLVLAPFGSE
ncbi:SnoaL/DnrD family polyketide biosynthesis methyl ester cyclase [Nocardiopsis dassonvillei]|uniref:SnoaL/DnrD family polyketide biosynthesis methyl ester cyclase n=1 Tax=Nocardiopsis dassonvillei TaxID=2014 RepID=UPI0036440903